jgi:hypothetical protein
LFFDGKYPLTREISLLILRAAGSNTYQFNFIDPSNIE